MAPDEHAQAYHEAVRALEEAEKTGDSKAVRESKAKLQELRLRHERHVQSVIEKGTVEVKVTESDREHSAKEARKALREAYKAEIEVYKQLTEAVEASRARKKAVRESLKRIRDSKEDKK